jgi:hypothetical protein
MLDRRRIIRVISPAEHGSWGWLLIPFVAGVVVAGTLNLPAAIFLLASLSAFLLRQPAAVWLRCRIGRSDPAKQAIASSLTISLFILAATSMAALLFWKRYQLWWIVILFVVLFSAYLYANLSGKTVLRSLWNEIFAAVGLASTSPAVIIAANGGITRPQLAIGIFMAIQNVMGALYIRLRIADQHGLKANRFSVLSTHALGVLFSMGICLYLNLNPFLIAPFLLALIRSIWFAAKPEPVASMKRLGFTEVAFELASALWIAAHLRT